MLRVRQTYRKNVEDWARVLGAKGLHFWLYIWILPWDHILDQFILELQGINWRKLFVKIGQVIL